MCACVFYAQNANAFSLNRFFFLYSWLLYFYSRIQMIGMPCNFENILLCAPIFLLNVLICTVHFYCPLLLLRACRCINEIKSRKFIDVDPDKKNGCCFFSLNYIFLHRHYALKFILKIK